MLSDEQMRARFAAGWGSGGKETRCGVGSMMRNTVAVRALLPDLARRYYLTSIADAGAGDLNWIQHVAWPDGVEYRPYDLVPRAEGVTELDITRQQLPACDLILCRYVLNHLDRERVRAALDLFRLSGFYLLATQHSGHLDDTNADYVEYDLRDWLGEPLESHPDTRGELTLWTL